MRSRHPKSKTIEDSPEEAAQFVAKRTRPRNAGPYDYTGTNEEVPVLTRPAGGALTPETLEYMRRAVATGCPIPTAATAIGCGGQWRNWGTHARNHERQGRPAGWGEGESKYLLWLQTMDQAKAVFEAQLVGLISEAAKFDWRAGTWLLEHMAPRRWNLPTRLEIAAKRAGGQADISKMPTDSLLQIARGAVPQLQATNEPAEAELVPDDKE